MNKYLHFMVLILSLLFLGGCSSMEETIPTENGSYNRKEGNAQ